MKNSRPGVGSKRDTVDVVTNTSSPLSFVILTKEGIESTCNVKEVLLFSFGESKQETEELQVMSDPVGIRGADTRRNISQWTIENEIK